MRVAIHSSHVVWLKLPLLADKAVGISIAQPSHIELLVEESRFDDRKEQNIEVREGTASCGKYILLLPSHPFTG